MKFLSWDLKLTTLLHFIVELATFKDKVSQTVCILAPLFPAILCFSAMIWKDVGFAFGYLFCVSLLTKALFEEKSFSPLVHVLFLSVLFYATAIKFQARYCVFILVWWYVFYHRRSSRFLVKLPAFITVLGAFYLSLYGVNKLLVPVESENHSWQYVKLYDIAAVSVASNQDLFPDFNHTPLFSMEKLKKVIQRTDIHKSVDDLIFIQNAPLKACATSEERDILFKTWINVITCYPVKYALHRLDNLSYMIFNITGFQKIDAILKNTFTEGSWLYTGFHLFFKIIGLLVLSPLLPSLLCWPYAYYGYKKRHEHKEAIPLMVFSLVSCTLLSVMYFFSMAGTPRYVYLVSCFGLFSHLFAYGLYKKSSRL